MILQSLNRWIYISIKVRKLAAYADIVGCMLILQDDADIVVYLGRYFDAVEYLLTDKAYALERHIFTPY